MTRNEAVELVVYGNWFDLLCESLSDDEASELSKAIGIVKKELLSFGSNDALTLEQLREMDGSPVWYRDADQWFIVELNHPDFGGCVINSSGYYIPLKKAAARGFYAKAPAQINIEGWKAEWTVDEFGHKCSKCGEYLPSGDDEITPQFCPSCGRATTPDALKELERRLMGGIQMIKDCITKPRAGVRCKKEGSKYVVDPKKDEPIIVARAGCYIVPLTSKETVVSKDGALVSPTGKFWRSAETIDPYHIIFDMF